MENVINALKSEKYSEIEAVGRQMWKDSENIKLPKARREALYNLGTEMVFANHYAKKGMRAYAAAKVADALIMARRLS